MKTASPGFGGKHASSPPPPVRERPRRIGFSGARLQARIDAALFPASSTTHASVLAGLARQQSVCYRMHLDREHFTYVEELQQQRESVETPASFPITVLEIASST